MTEESIYVCISIHGNRKIPISQIFGDRAYGGISNCNRVIYQLDNLDFEVTGKESVIAELEVAVLIGITYYVRLSVMYLL